MKWGHRKDPDLALGFVLCVALSLIVVLLIMVHIFLIVFLLLSAGSIHSSAENESENREDCPPFECGNLGSINFPFTTLDRLPHCGLLTINGCGEAIQRVQLERGGRWYPVYDIYDDYTVFFIRDEVFLNHISSNSCDTFNNLTFPSSPLLSFQSTAKPKLTLLKCDQSVHVPSSLGHVHVRCDNFSVFYAPQPQILQNLQSQCALIQLPTKPIPSDNINDIYDSLSADFPLEVNVSPDCEKCFYNVGGECLVSGEGKFYCSKPEKGDKKSKLKFAVVGAVAAGIAVAIISLCYFRRQVSYNNNVIVCWNKTSNDDKSIESFLVNHGSLMQKRYSYSEIKKMTESFRDKLGQGGYGCVFKGRLPDGRLVAVKVLKESRTNGEEFINEVASISRTSHVNIVSFFGFCAEGSKRALIYEFMSNGSLEKYIHQSPSQLDHQLGWEMLYQIAIGIAQGLEYLHRGCNTRILHFDIKPHNILLDENFCPKISDFGLAKVCLQRESSISMLGARGTAGYIAPEVFFRSFGGVSHKSDVYSYGMMVLEMVGGRRNISKEVENTSETYFPDWIHKNLESGEELGLREIRNEDENQLARRMIIVSLWCIQTKPSDRPTMSRVIEMLQGSVQPLLIPPRPYLSSAPRSPPRLETNSSTTLGCDTLE